MVALVGELDGHLNVLMRCLSLPPPGLYQHCLILISFLQNTEINLSFSISNITRPLPFVTASFIRFLPRSFIFFD